MYFILFTIITAVILSAFFLFSVKFRYVIIGGGLAASAIYVFVSGIRSKEGINTQVSIVGLILLISGIGLFVFGTQQAAFVLSDTNVLGDGDKVSITASAGNGVDNIILDIPASQINSEIQGEGWVVKSGIRMTLDLVDYKQQYALELRPQENFRKIESVNVGNAGFDVSESSLISKCVSKGYSTTIDAVAVGRFAGFQDLYCFYTKVFGTNGNINSVSNKLFIVNLNAGGTSDTLTETKQTASLANGNIFVSFKALLQGKSSLERPNYNVFFQNNIPKFLISVGSVTYTDINHPKTTMNICSNSFGSSISDIDRLSNTYISCMNNYNQNMLNSIVDVSGSLSDVVNTISYSGSQMILDIKENTVEQFPLLQIIVNGKYLGIERLSGIPEIQEINSKCFEDAIGKNGEVIDKILSVKNVGSSNSRFLIGVTCDNNKITSVTNNINSIAPNSISSTNVRITGSSTNINTKESSVCTLIVTDEGSQKQDSCSYNVEYEFANVICQPRTIQCNPDKTQTVICSDDGTKLNILATCSATQSCGLDGNNIKCIDKGLSITLPTLPIFDGTSTEAASNAALLQQQECKLKAEDNKLFGYQYIETERTTLFVFKSKVGECKATNLPYIFAGILILILIILSIFLIISTKKNKRIR